MLRRKVGPKPVRGIEGLRAPLVGRERELNEIKSALAELRRSKGSVVALIGEAGLGKSRMVAEARVALPENIGFGEGRALSYTTGMSYWMVSEAS